MRISDWSSDVCSSDLTLTDSKLIHVYVAKKTGGHNEPEYWVRGKTLGGSSSLNGMVYVRGQPSDYDEWNCDGWRWADLMPHFKALENHELGASAIRGTGGPLHLTIRPTHLPVLEAMLAPAAEMAVPTVDTLTSINAAGFAPQ